MSNKAQDWAWSQNLPPKVKCLLVALADQADDLGFVRYRDTTPQFFMGKCNIPRRTFYRTMAALIRLGYVKRETHLGRGQVSDIWVRLDRSSTPLEAWTWNVSDTQDVEVGVPVVAHQDSELVCHGEHIGVPLVALQDSIVKPKIPTPTDKKAVKAFLRSAQAVEVPPPRPKVFVAKGTRAWDAQVADRRRRGLGPPPVTGGQGDHAGKTGWYFASLFPPSATGPPDDGVDDAAANEFAQTG